MTPLVVIDWFLAYAVGSVSGSLLLGRLRRVDIRLVGSGNAGGTNALRTQGFWFALGVVIIDVGKGVLAAAVLAGLLAPGGPAWQPLACGFAAIFGHCYPLWHGFRGGKGAATLVGVIAAVQWVLLVPMLLTWFVVLVLSGYVGLATMFAAASLVPAALWIGQVPGLLPFAIVMALFVVFTHRSNIRNLRSGAEHRFERVRWLRRR